MRCELENITVHYELYGEGRPILMLHGWAGDHRPMVTAMEPLFTQRGGWQRIYPDLPGMGRTPAPAWLATQDQVLDVVLAFIDKVIPGQRFAVIGVSYGGFLARGVVYRRAAWMDGVLLQVPLIKADPAAQHLPPKTTLVADPEFGAQMEAVGAQGYLDLPVVQGPKAVEWAKAIMPVVQMADHAFLGRLKQAYDFSFDVDRLAEPFTGPTLILTGRQDHGCGYRDAWDLLETYPRATFAVLDRAGHLVRLEQEMLAGALTREWLDRVEEHARAATPQA
jgi:pimeloyl-ACP methyl ester carboxylesterase